MARGVRPFPQVAASSGWTTFKEVMIEFDDFDPGSDVALDEKLQVVARDIIASECAMRQTCIQLTGHEKTCQMRADEAQLKCILKSMLLAV